MIYSIVQGVSAIGIEKLMQTTLCVVRIGWRKSTGKVSRTGRSLY